MDMIVGSEKGYTMPLDYVCVDCLDKYEMSWLYWINKGKTKKCRVCGKEALAFQIETERLRDENGKPVEILEESDDE